jgi:hypothetical protein
MAWQAKTSTTKATKITKILVLFFVNFVSFVVKMLLPSLALGKTFTESLR